MGSRVEGRAKGGTERNRKGEKDLHQFQSSSSAILSFAGRLLLCRFDREDRFSNPTLALFFTSGINTGVPTGPSRAVLSSSSSSSNELCDEFALDNVEGGKSELEGSGCEALDGEDVVEGPRTAAMLCDMSEMRREARFWLLVNLGDINQRKYKRAETTYVELLCI